MPQPRWTAVKYRYNPDLGSDMSIAAAQVSGRPERFKALRGLDIRARGAQNAVKATTLARLPCSKFTHSSAL